MTDVAIPDHPNLAISQITSKFSLTLAQETYTQREVGEEWGESPVAVVVRPGLAPLPATPLVAGLPVLARLQRGGGGGRGRRGGVLAAAVAAADAAVAPRGGGGVAGARAVGAGGRGGAGGRRHGSWRRAARGRRRGGV